MSLSARYFEPISTVSTASTMRTTLC